MKHGRLLDLARSKRHNCVKLDAGCSSETPAPAHPRLASNEPANLNELSRRTTSRARVVAWQTSRRSDRDRRKLENRLSFLGSSFGRGFHKNHLHPAVRAASSCSREQVKRSTSDPGTCAKKTHGTRATRATHATHATHGTHEQRKAGTKRHYSYAAGGGHLRESTSIGDENALTIGHQLRYARPAVLPSTGAPRASWNRLPHRPTPSLPLCRHRRATEQHRSPLTPSRFHATPFSSPRCSQQPYPLPRSLHLETLGNEQPPSKAGSVTRPTIILQT